MVDLFDEDEDVEGAPSPFADAGALVGRKPIGRPKGATNRKTKAFEQYFVAKGFRDPLVAAAQVVTEDPVALLAWFRTHDRKGSKGLRLIDVIKLQLEAGRDLAPYLHGKAPVRVQIEGQQLPMLVINTATNQHAEAHRLLEGKARSIGRPEPETSEINDLDDGGAGPSHGTKSHGRGK